MAISALPKPPDTCKLEQAAKRISDNPFSVSSSDIKLIEPDLVICLDKNSKALRAKVKFRSKAKRLIESHASTHYLKAEKAYYIPVTDLNHILKRCRDKQIVFAVEEAAAQVLNNAAKLRSQILSGQRGACESDLIDSMLFPYISLEKTKESGETLFSIKECTSIQLKQLLPVIEKGYRRTTLASKLSKPDLLKLLYQLKFLKIKVWLTEEVQSFLSNLVSKCQETIELTPQGFSDTLLALAQPEICLALSPSSSAVCIVEKKFYKKHLKTSSLASLEATPNEKFKDHKIFLIRDSEILTVESALNDLLENKAARTKNYLDYLSVIHKRQQLLNRTKSYQKLSDIPVKSFETSLTPQSKQLLTKLYPHQRVALAWLIETDNAFLGDDMGLGKTLTLLSLFEVLRAREQADFLLVVCPNSLTRNWIRESKLWFQNLRLECLPEGKKEREKFLQRLTNTAQTDLHGLVINYEALRIESVYPLVKSLCEKHNTVLCLDESQRVKNPNSKSFQALNYVAQACTRRVLLSGTPTPRDISDIWAQMMVLDRGERFGTNYYSWLEQIAFLGNKWSSFAVRKFRDDEVQEAICRVQEILLRRKKEDVIDLPDKTFSTRDIELSGDQKKRYDQIRKELLLRISSTRGKSFLRQIDNILEEYLRAVQVASNPRLVDQTWKGTPAKFLELDQIVEEVVRQHREKIVIWTNYRANVEELLIRYKELGAAGYSGEVQVSERDEIVENFQNGKLNILVAIPAAGGVGITLTAAQTAVYLDKTWNGEHWMQSIDRIHRIGQTGTVNIISLHAGKVDRLVSKNLSAKTKAQARLLGDGKGDDILTPSREILIESLQ